MKNTLHVDMKTMTTMTYRSVTLIGCALAIDRAYFFEVGAFDEGMEIWGGENIEFPVRVRIALPQEG